jgi:hypothetical protein
MGNLPGLLGRTVGDAAYDPASIRIFVGAAQEPAPSGFTQQAVNWPLAADPATAAGPTAIQGLRCFVLSGSDLSAFLGVARNANQLTVWIAPSGRYSVSVRPLYPEESGCLATAG